MKIEDDQEFIFVINPSNLFLVYSYIDYQHYFAYSISHLTVKSYQQKLLTDNNESYSKTNFVTTIDIPDAIR
jgi:hypothetical protein